MTQSRIRVLDVGRGFAMLFVFLSHFIEYYLVCHKKINLLHFLWKFTQLASPTFMLISGITLGYLFSLKKKDFGQTRIKFIDKGLFLISIAHVLILFSWLPFIEFSKGSMHVLFITDTIGFCLIVGPLLISRFKPYERILISIILYSISWTIISFGVLENPYLNKIAEIFFGSKSSSYFDIFPILPWFSLYLLGTTIGEKLNLYQIENHRKSISRFFFRIGLLSFSIAFIVLSLHKILKIYGFHDSETMMDLVSKYHKNPPGLIYVLLYGGSGMIVLSLLNKLIENDYFPLVFKNLEVIGKTSLFAFVLQYFMYFSLIVWFNPPYWGIWPLFFLITLIVNIIIIRFWNKRGLNKYITVLNFSVWKSSPVINKSLKQ